MDASKRRNMDPEIGDQITEEESIHSERVQQCQNSETTQNLTEKAQVLDKEHDSDVQLSQKKQYVDLSAEESSSEGKKGGEKKLSKEDYIRKINKNILLSNLKILDDDYEQLKNKWWTDRGYSPNFAKKGGHINGFDNGMSSFSCYLFFTRFFCFSFLSKGFKKIGKCRGVCS